MRINKEQINSILQSLNLRMQNRDLVVRYTSRNGYKALDLYRISDNNMLHCIESGLTANTAYTYISAMIKGIQLVNPEKYGI